MTPRSADAFVAFGITGNLAKEMTYASLYRLESRGVLDCPIIGVAADDWTLPQLRRRMRESIKQGIGQVDRATFDRLAARLSYVRGDFADAATYEQLAKALDNARAPVFYLETPPALFATVVGGLASAGLAGNARVVVEKPFGHDLASAKSLAAELHRSIREQQIFRVDHFLGKLGLEELLYLRHANAMLAPLWSREHVASVQITMAESFGVEDRGHFYDAVGALRDVVVNHLLQLLAAAAMEAPRKGETLDAARHRLLRAVTDADPSRYVRGQYTGYRSTKGVARGSTTETYAALELRVDNERWRGVPFFIRTGKHLAVTQTELRMIFRDAAPLSFLGQRTQPSANELVLRIDPATGLRMILEARRADAMGPEPITLGMDFSHQGGAGPTPYETLLAAALKGDHSPFTRQETVEEEWRIVQPLLDSLPPAQSYRRGSWGPKAAHALLPAGQHWRRTWTPDTAE